MMQQWKPTFTLFINFKILKKIMRRVRSWNFRIYPTKKQEKHLQSYLYECKNLWNYLLNHAKEYYETTGHFPTRNKLYELTKNKSELFSQVAQNVAERIIRALNAVISRKKRGIRAGFPRFKSIDRIKSFTYPQKGFSLEEKLMLSQIGEIQIKKHRTITEELRTLTIKRMSSGKWFAIFTSQHTISSKSNKGKKVGIDLGIEHFAYLSDGISIPNPRHIIKAEEKLKKAHQKLSHKRKGSKNRKKARIRLSISHEKLANNRREFLHQVTRKLVNSYSLIAMEDLNTQGLARGFLAKHVLDCGWAEFSKMLHYKAEEAGCEVVLVNPAYTSQECSNCGLIQKKKLAERAHKCSCGADMHRDLNAAINILKRATSGTGGSNASGATKFLASMKEEVHVLDMSSSRCQPYT